jgi:hypothetical protein
MIFDIEGSHRFMHMLQRSEDVVQLMLDVLSGLPNVTDYFCNMVRTDIYQHHIF